MSHMRHAGKSPQAIAEDEAYAEWEAGMFARLDAAIAEAIEVATEIWDPSYAVDYVRGRAERYRPQDPEGPGRVKSKQVISQGLRTQVFERDAYRCRHCSGWEDLTVDHIFPESKGGTLDLDNLQTLCRSCNSSKGTA